MILSLTFTSLLILAGVSAQFEVPVDQLGNTLQDPAYDVPALYIPPQARAEAAATTTSTSSTSTPTKEPPKVFFVVELFNALQNLATALVQPFTVILKPKPSLTPAAAASLAVSSVPGSLPSVQISSQTASSSSSPSSPQAPEQGPKYYPVPGGFVLA